jgi:protein-S-isoprenylcysteine O-methyltransferase Ste14
VAPESITQVDTAEPAVLHAPSGNPFADPHYGEEAEHGDHVIASKPTWSLEDNQRALTGWVGAAITLIGAVLMVLYPDPPDIIEYIDRLPFSIQDGILRLMQLIWEFKAAVLLTAIFIGQFLVETLVFKVQRRHFDFSAPRALDADAWKRVGGRWLAMLAIVLAGTFLYGVVGEYNFHEWPYKQRFFYYRYYHFYFWAVGAALVICLPYFWLVEHYAKANGPIDEFLVLAKCLKRFFLSNLLQKEGRQQMGAALKNPHVHNLSLGMLVKFFFVPLMLTWCLNNWNDWQVRATEFLTAWRRLPSSDPFFVAHMFRHFHQALLFLIVALDTSVAVVGYLASMRLLDTQVTSAEPTMLGWMMALFCYPPFNNIHSLFLEHENMEVYPQQLFYLYPAISIAASAGILILMGIYTYATFSFGLRFSNLTNRGVICCGPYRWVRHPAYITKNTAWWLAMLPACFYLTSFKAILLNCVRLAGTNLVYYLRAWTEERHMMREPHYREYCQKVPYKFIPGIW